MPIRLSPMVTAVGITLTIGIIIILVRRRNWSVLVPLLFGLVASVVFGAIDAFFFLTAEKELDKFLEERGVPSELVPLIVGAVSASISIFIASYLEHFLGKRFDITKSPFLDALGIILGTVLISVGYIAYLGYKKSYNMPLTASSEAIVKGDPVLLS